MSRRTIDGIRALVTGASSGIGLALAHELSRRGARLVVMARRTERLDALRQELASRSQKSECIAVAGDVTSAADRRRALDAAQQSFSGLDLLINNAGIGALGPFAEATPERLRQIFEVNFFAAIELTRQALPLLRASQGATIVNIGSVLGYRALPNSSEYCASKFALRGWSESLRLELQACGIQVLHVSPATTESDFTANLLEARTPPAARARRATPAATVAGRVVAAIERGDRELCPDLRSWGIVRAARHVPGLIDWWLRRSQR